MRTETEERNYPIESANLKTLRMYALIHDTITLLDPVTGQWYSVPRRHAKEIEPHDDMWNVFNNYDYLRIEAWQWMRDTEEDFFNSNFVDTPAGDSIVLQIDDKTFAITEAIYHQIQADLEAAGARPDVKSDTGETQGIFIYFFEPQIMGGNEAKNHECHECGELVLYHAAEVKIFDSSDIPF